MDADQRDFFAAPLSRQELEDVIQLAGGVRTILAANSPAFRKLGRPVEDWLDEELVELILGEPRLLRRPLLITDDGRVLVGGKAVSSSGPTGPAGASST